MAEDSTVTGPGPATRQRRRDAALKAWDKRGRRKERGVDAQAASRGDWANKNAQIVANLKNGRVTSSKKLGGGISETYKITLEDGTEANFKVSDTPEAEVASWEVAQLVGMDDMVPPAVIRKAPTPKVELRDLKGNVRVVGGVEKLGSVALWQPGERAAKVWEDELAKNPRAEPTAHWGTSVEDVKRAAMYDYITGNCDRHEGNWVVDNGKVRLIDHNLSFQSRAYSELLNRTISVARNESPAKYVSKYVERKGEILSRLKATGLSAHQIEWVSKRIDRAASAKSWDDIYEHNNNDLS